MNFLQRIGNALSRFMYGRNGVDRLTLTMVWTALVLDIINIFLREKVPLAYSIIGTVAGDLHDIGKIAIDEKILNKPGRLTPEEFDLVKTHSMRGAEMLHDLDNFGEQPLLQTAYEIARWHHERWDGKGYPDGLKGDDIPISAQLVSMADVYDALTSERCYKKAFPHETAVQMITNGECGAFNPLLLQCLLDVQGKLKQEILQW